MWSLAVPHRHTLYGDYRVTEGCWADYESTEVPVVGVDRPREGVWCGNRKDYSGR